MWNLSSIRSLLVNFFRFTISHFPKRASRSVLMLLSHFGGMPFLAELNYNEKASKMYLSDAFSSVVVKDIARRNNIRDIDLLERIIVFVMSNMGCTFSASYLSRYFKGWKTLCS